MGSEQCGKHAGVRSGCWVGGAAVYGIFVFCGR